GFSLLDGDDAHVWGWQLERAEGLIDLRQSRVGITRVCITVYEDEVVVGIDLQQSADLRCDRATRTVSLEMPVAPLNLDAANPGAAAEAFEHLDQGPIGWTLGQQ